VNINSLFYEVSEYNYVLWCFKFLLVILASSSECERHFSAFNVRNLITSQRNMMFPETVEALPIVLEGYKNKLIQ